MMKILKSLIAISCMLSPLMNAAQDIPKSQVPEEIRNSFKQSFPNASGEEWEMKGNLYEVEFETGYDKDHEIWYDQSGKMVRHKEELSERELPAKIQSAIQREFKGYRIDDIKKITADNTVRYHMELKKGKEEWDVVFSADGKILEKRPD